jgi:hypothetical protein
MVVAARAVLVIVVVTGLEERAVHTPAPLAAIVAVEYWQMV